MTSLNRTASSRRNESASFHFLPLALVVGLLFTSTTQAAISGINTPGTSNASVNFNDTNSVAPPAGITNTGPAVSPWNGAAVTLPSTTDPNTSDFATGSIVGSFAGNTYAINLNTITLTQAVGNTGFADLDFNFSIEYQLDGLGLPTQPTLFPNIIVNGTVQNIASSFALVSGFINYEAVNTAGAISLIETVNYNSIWNTPGPFTGTAFGVPTFGTTPALIPNTTLTLTGFIHFRVDPATINAQSVTVPEPSTLVLGMAGLAGLSFVRLRKKLRRA
jgi:hypothetical protein